MTTRDQQSFLITGGAGFIGSHLSDRLLSEGHTVAVLDDLSTGGMENLAQARDQPRFEFHEGSVRDASKQPGCQEGAQEGDGEGRRHEGERAREEEDSRAAPNQEAEAESHGESYGGETVEDDAQGAHRLRQRRQQST